MLCMWIMLLCLSMVSGGGSFDWSDKLSKEYKKMEKADNNRNIPDMMALLSDDVTFDPPGLPPIRGKQALSDTLESILQNGQWSQQIQLKFEKVIAECKNTAVAEHSEEKVMFDGKIYRGRGVCVFTREKRQIKGVACSWNADGPLTEPEGP